MVVHCLELPNRRLVRRKMLLVLVALKKSRAVKVGVDDRNEIWKEHMETLMNVENEWNDSTDASKVEDAVRRIAVNRCGVQ